MTERKRPSRKLDPHKLPPVDVNQRYTVDEAGAYLRKSRTSIYDDIAAGRLRIIKEGARTFVPGSEIAGRCRLSEAA